MHRLPHHFFETSSSSTTTTQTSRASIAAGMQIKENKSTSLFLGQLNEAYIEKIREHVNELIITFNEKREEFLKLNHSFEERLNELKSVPEEAEEIRQTLLKNCKELAASYKQKKEELELINIDLRELKEYLTGFNNFLTCYNHKMNGIGSIPQTLQPQTLPVPVAPTFNSLSNTSSFIPPYDNDLLSQLNLLSQLRSLAQHSQMPSASSFATPPTSSISPGITQFNANRILSTAVGAQPYGSLNATNPYLFLPGPTPLHPPLTSSSSFSGGGAPGAEIQLTRAQQAFPPIQNLLNFSGVQRGPS